MIGFPEQQRSWWMAHGMARASGLHLARAVVDGWLTRSDLARMVQSCAHCSKTSECQQWLADPSHTTPPDFCRIGPEISALAPAHP